MVHTFWSWLKTALSWLYTLLSWLNTASSWLNVESDEHSLYGSSRLNTTSFGRGCGCGWTQPFVVVSRLHLGCALNRFTTVLVWVEHGIILVEHCFVLVERGIWWTRPIRFVTVEHHLVWSWLRLRLNTAFCCRFTASSWLGPKSDHDGTHFLVLVEHGIVLVERSIRWTQPLWFVTVEHHLVLVEDAFVLVERSKCSRKTLIRKRCLAWTLHGKYCLKNCSRLKIP